MDLLRHLQDRRSEKRRKSPFRPTLYTRLAGLVKRHGLDDEFLRVLGTPRQPLVSEGERALRLKRKESFEAPLFSLCTEEEHRVTLAILRSANVPYLEFATSPDEILACRELFERNPSLSPERLGRHHFETLLLAERLGTQVGEPTKRG